LRYFIPPFQYSKQYAGNLSLNFKKFILNNFHLPNDAGLKRLIEAFYKSILENSPLPLSYREILLTAKIMDEIFRQIGNKKLLGKTE
jgi:hypothetical protein